MTLGGSTSKGGSRAAYLELVLAGLMLRAWVEKVNGESLEYLR